MMLLAWTPLVCLFADLLDKAWKRFGAPHAVRVPRGTTTPYEDQWLTYGELQDYASGEWFPFITLRLKFLNTLREHFSYVDHESTYCVCYPIIIYSHGEWHAYWDPLK